jgi:hypothetical protein
LFSRTIDYRNIVASNLQSYYIAGDLEFTFRLGYSKAVAILCTYSVVLASVLFVQAGQYLLSAGDSLPPTVFCCIPGDVIIGRWVTLILVWMITFRTSPRCSACHGNVNVNVRTARAGWLCCQKYGSGIHLRNVHIQLQDNAVSQSRIPQCEQLLAWRRRNVDIYSQEIVLAWRRQNFANLEETCSHHRLPYGGNMFYRNVDISSQEIVGCDRCLSSCSEAPQKFIIYLNYKWGFTPWQYY